MPIETQPTVALIGSFRQHYSQVMDAWRLFNDHGIVVTSPRGTPILKEGIPFVRFESDSEDMDDASIQTLALHRIMRADLVLVVAPGGYVGRTTCYEIGRLIQARRPLYSTEAPKDLPLRIGEEHIASAKALAEGLSLKTVVPLPLYAGSARANELSERLLLDGDLRADTLLLVETRVSPYLLRRIMSALRRAFRELPPPGQGLAGASTGERTWGR